MQEMAGHFSLQYETVKSFCRHRDFILSSIDKRKKMRLALFPEFEKDVLKFVRLVRSLRLPLHSYGGNKANLALYSSPVTGM